MKKRYTSDVNYSKSLLNFACIGILFALLFLFNSNAYAATVKLAWTARNNSAVAGYKIYYGTSSSDFSNSIKVSKSTSCSISNLDEGNKYYFAAAVYNSKGQESPLSNKVSTYIPVSKSNPTQNDVVYRINAGGPAVKVNGVAWSSDRYSSGRSGTYKKSVSIGGTSNDVLYQTERYGKDFTYNLPVPKGTYKVTLHFAEIYFTSRRSRIFDIEVEKNQYVLRDFDIVGQAGAKNAVVKTINNIRVTDGKLSVRFDAISNNAKISAIEVNLVSASL